MGLILNGTIQGKQYIDEQLSADEILTIFDLRDNFIELGKSMRFDLLESRMKWVGGEQLHPTQQSVVTTTQGSYKGDSFELTYFKTRNRKATQNGITHYDYKPRKIYFQGVSHMVNVEREKDEAVYLMLSTAHELSPCRKPGRKALYKVHNQRKEAMMSMAKSKAQFTIMERIMKEDISIIRSKAMGMGLGDMTEKDEEVVRMKLLEYFQKEVAHGRFTKFESKFDSPVSLFQGIVMEAVQRNVLMQKAQKGRFVFLWGHGTEREGKIAHEVQKNVVPIESLLDFAGSNYEVFVKQVEKEIEKARKNALLDETMYKVQQKEAALKPKTASEMDNAELVKECHARDIVEYNRQEDAVYLLKSGEYEGKPIVEKAGKDWRNTVVEVLNNNVTLRKKIEKKVQLHINRNK